MQESEQLKMAKRGRPPKVKSDSSDLPDSESAIAISGGAGGSSDVDDSFFDDDGDDEFGDIPLTALPVRDVTLDIDAADIMPHLEAIEKSVDNAIDKAIAAKVPLSSFETADSAVSSIAPESLVSKLLITMTPFVEGWQHRKFFRELTLNPDYREAHIWAIMQMMCRCVKKPQRGTMRLSAAMAASTMRNAGKGIWETGSRDAIPTEVLAMRFSNVD